jgi:hypothetical protein
LSLCGIYSHKAILHINEKENKKMANIPAQLYRGDSDYLDTISNVDGQILFDTDKKEIFMDDGTTRESYGGGAGDKVYATKAEAIADLANISDTDTVFVKEGTSTDMQTITYATWLTYSDAQKEAFNGYITNFPNEAMNASAVTYDNTDSGLTADNVQEAIDEINSVVLDIGKSITISGTTGADGILWTDKDLTYCVNAFTTDYGLNSVTKLVKASSINYPSGIYCELTNGTPITNASVTIKCVLIR